MNKKKFAGIVSMVSLCVCLSACTASTDNADLTDTGQSIADVEQASASFAYRDSGSEAPGTAASASGEEQEQTDYHNEQIRYIKEYADKLTFDEKLVDQRTDIYGNTAMVWNTLLTDDNELVVEMTRITFDKGKVKGEPVVKRFDDVADYSDFAAAYCMYGGMQGSYKIQKDEYPETLSFVDIFKCGLCETLAGEKDYYSYDTAAIKYFHLKGGAISNVKTGGHKASFTYDFADGNSRNIYMCELYNGMWAPIAIGDYQGVDFVDNDRKGTNQWYWSVTKEELDNAKRVEDNSIEWYNDNAVILAEAPDMGIVIYSGVNYYNDDSIMVDHNGERSILYMPWDMMNRPEYRAFDYDGDGVTEIALVNCVGRGTGVFMQNVTVIDSDDGVCYNRISSLATDDIYAYVKDNSIMNYNDGEGIISIKLKNTESTCVFRLSDVALNNYVIEKLGFSEHCYCTLEDNDIMCRVLLGAVLESSAQPVVLTNLVDDSAKYPDSLGAGIKYNKDGTFSFTGCDFSYQNKQNY